MYKKLIEGKKAVFFDLDGTISDTTPLWISAVGAVLEEQGINWISDENKFVPGQNLDVTWKELLKRYEIKTEKTPNTLSQETNAHFLKILETSELNVRDGFWELFYELKVDKNFRTALLTNSTKAVAEKILEKLGVDNIFECFVYGDEITKPKPDPEIYLKTLKQMELSPQEVLVFEDSVIGTKAAQLANLTTVVIWDGETNQEEFKGEKVVLFLPDFSPLPKHLDFTPQEWLDYNIKIAEEEEKRATEVRASDLGN